MKGWQLLKEIAEGNIKEGTKFKVFEKGELYFSNYVIYEKQTLKNDGTELTEFLTLANIVHLDFEIIEEQEEINIQDIKEFNEIRDLSEWSNKTLSDNQRIFNTKINEVIRGLKQLDNKIKENK